MICVDSKQQSHPLSNKFRRQKLNYDFPQDISMFYNNKKLYIFQQSEKNWNFRRKYIFFYIEACVTEGSFGYLPLTTAFERIVWSGQYQLLVPFLRFELKQTSICCKRTTVKDKILGEIISVPTTQTSTKRSRVWVA